jgi:hypothetical protein
MRFTRENLERMSKNELVRICQESSGSPKSTLRSLTKAILIGMILEAGAAMERDA